LDRREHWRERQRWHGWRTLAYFPCVLATCLTLVVLSGGTPLRAQERAQSSASKSAAQYDDTGTTVGPAFLPWPEEGLSGEAEETGEDLVSDADELAEQPGFDPARLALLPVLRVGLVLDPGGGDFSRIEPLRAMLEEGMRLPVIIVAYRDLSHLRDALMRGEVDYAPLSATAFADAQDKCNCLQVLAVARDSEGGTGWHALALVREDAPFAGLQDLADARLAVALPGSTAGRELPLAALAGIGITPPPEHLVEVAGPLAAARAVLSGRADVAFGWSSSVDAQSGRGTLQDLLARDGARPPLRIIWVSDEIANAPQVVRDSVPDAIRRDLANLLTVAAGESGDPQQAGETPVNLLAPHGLAPADAAHFEPLVELTRQRRRALPGRLRPLIENAD
jgi:ABC-type phosphate/phosphonate transport system substrate-binding protein